MATNSDYTFRWNEQQYVSSYVRFTKPVRFDLDTWIRRLKLESDSTVVDIGCGEGRLLSTLSNRIGKGIGVDGSPHTVALARERLSAADIQNVSIIQSDFRSFSIDEGVANSLVSIAALHHVCDSDKVVVFDRIYETLKPGGVFYLEDDSFNFQRGKLGTLTPEIHAQWERQFGRANWTILKDELAGDDFEHTSFLADLEEMVTASGLGISDVSPTGLNGVRLTAIKP
jgi:ubiquinone/menaquinone biosynthesis C-methylase UbiE